MANGLRYTWIDAFGVVLLVSLYAELGDVRLRLSWGLQEQSSFGRVYAAGRTFRARLASS